MTPVLAFVLGIVLGAVALWWFQRGKEERSRRQAEDLTRVQGILREYVVQRELAEDELRATADALRQSEATYRMLAESMDDVVTIANLDGIITYASPSVERLAGWTVAETVGTHHMTNVHPDDVERVEAEKRNGFAAAGHARFEWRCRRRDGAYVWLETRSTLVREPDGAMHVVTVSRDIEQRKHAEEAYRRLEERASALIERAAYGIYVSTPEGRFLDVNPALVQMLGYPSREALLAIDIARDIYQDPAKRAELTRNAEVSDRPEWVEVEWRRADGTPITVQLAVRAVRDAQGRISVYEGIAEDVTERRRRDEILRRSERMASLGTMVAGVAHELNNPLAAISGFAQLMLREAKTAEERGGLETINHEATRAAKIVRDLLTFTRRQDRVRHEAHDLNTIVQYIAGSRRYAMETRGIQITMRLAAELPPVMGDRTQLEQVVLNLLVNAEQALAGMVDGAEASGRRATLLLETMMTKGMVSLVVEDNGPGIPEEHQSRIWDPFWTTKPEGEGTGLGLAVVHGIVSAHGGSIELTSKPGQGTRFVVRLRSPVSSAAAPADGASVPAEPVRRGPLDILVVDDEPSIVSLLVRYLGSRGHAVVSASDGEEALRVAEQTAFDVVICDYRMPGMDGAELITRMRAFPHAARTRWIVSTGDSASDSARARIEALAPHAVVAKPYNVEDLRRAVEDGAAM